MYTVHTLYWHLGLITAYLMFSYILIILITAIYMSHLIFNLTIVLIKLDAGPIISVCNCLYSLNEILFANQSHIYHLRARKFVSETVHTET